MIQRDYLIIGTGIGGASACEGVRKHDKRGSVTIVGAEIMPTYNRWMLSKDFLREKTAPLKKLGYFDQRWFDSHKIETRFATIVKQFNIERRLAVLGNGESIEFNKACLAMGSRPVRPRGSWHGAFPPTTPLTSQMMLLFGVFATVAVNCSVCPGSRLVLVGGESVIVTSAGPLIEKFELHPMRPIRPSVHTNAAERRSMGNLQSRSPESSGTGKSSVGSKVT